MKPTTPMPNHPLITRLSGQLRVWLGLGCLLLTLAGGGSLSAQVVRPLQTTGPATNRVCFLFLAEGYTADQQQQFFADATNLFSRFLAAEPFARYQGYFNADACFVVSQQTGSDHPSQSYYRNTYFNSTYDSYGNSSLLTIPPNEVDPVYANGQGKVDALVATFSPRPDLVILLVNDANPAGSEQGGVVMVSRSASPNLLLHEAGHGLARLGDEYELAISLGTTNEEPNTTRETRPEFIKWKSWLTPDVPLPTPETVDYEEVVGLFEGAHYESTGWYRPKLNCRMRQVSEPFCEVCLEALVKALNRRVRTLDGWQQSVAGTNLLDDHRVLLTLNLVQPSDHPLAVRWLANGAALPGQTNLSLAFNPSGFPSGPLRIRVETRDDTPVVRTDAENDLMDTQEWGFAVQLPPPVVRLSSRRGSGAWGVEVSGNRYGTLHLETTTNLTVWIPLTSHDFTSGLFQTNWPIATQRQWQGLRALVEPLK